MNKHLLIKSIAILSSFCVISCSSSQDYTLVQTPSGETKPKNVTIIKSNIKGALSFSELFSMSQDFVVRLSPSQKLLDFSGELGDPASLNLTFSTDTEIIIDKNVTTIYETIDNPSNVVINFTRGGGISFSTAATPYNITFKTSDNKAIAQFSKTKKALTCSDIICTDKKTNQLRSSM